MKQFKSPAYKLITFFESSRDKWRERSDQYKAKLESMRSKVRSLEQSRDNWKDKYQQLAKETALEPGKATGTCAYGSAVSLAMEAGATEGENSLQRIKKQVK